jgi:glycogen debranching enzyme
VKIDRYPRSLRDALYRLGLEQNILPPQGAYKRPAMRVAPNYEQYGVQFVWDLPYSTIAVAQHGGRVDLARGFVENMCDFQLLDGPDAGLIPRSVTWQGDQNGQDGSQTPLLAWLAWKVHELEPDPEFLARVYPPLARSTDWWQSTRRDVDGDGLSEYGGSTPTYVSYEALDFSPERDIVVGEPTPPMDDGFVHEPFADVFLNSCIYGELDALASMAALVDPDRVAEWEQRRDRLASRMREAMWCDEIGGFFPVIRRDLCPSQPRVYRHTPSLFQPLFAGLATEDEAARTITLLTGGTYAQDEVLDVRIDPSLYHGYQVVTPALHPTAGTGPAAGGVGLASDGSSAVLRWGDDRSPRDIVFIHPWLEVEADGGPVEVLVEDGQGRALSVGDGARAAITPPEGRTWMRGISRLEVRVDGGVLRRIRFGFQRQERSGLLSPFGVKSAHPLDGKHPAPGYPTQFWSGTIWAPQTYHACHGLARYGRVDLAAAVARAYCDAVATSFAMSGHAYEHLSHLDGHGLNAVDYTWTASIALVLMKDLLDAEG